MTRILRLGLTTPDLERATHFYEAAFGCRRSARVRLEGADFERLFQVAGGAQRQLLALGGRHLELLQFDRPGKPYPADGSPYTMAFQHFAIVVQDMERALERLAGTDHWRPISTAGAERLPPASGGATAFKFRDPDGHPLEFLQLPRDGSGPAPRAATALLDHSALSVRSTEESVSFYSRLGFRVGATHYNEGPEQARLDGVAHASAQVTALRCADDGPHLELLCYATSQRRERLAAASNDVAATRIILEADGDPAGALLFDPDGHHVQVLQRPPADI